jgi:DNA-binding HxlR family transcriptional regulator
MSTRTYNQSCSLAIALDLIGERWTWLILRALLTGPKRYGELLEQLPGMGTNLLAERLKTLCNNGIAGRSGSGRQAAYELTAAGEELRPVAHGLIRWGRRFLDSVGNGPEPDGETAPIRRPEWDMLAIEAAFRPERSEGVQAIMQFTLSGFTFHLLIKNQECRAVTGASVAPDVCITSDSGTLMALGRQETSVAREEDKVRLKIEGDRDVFNLLFELFE